VPVPQVKTWEDQFLTYLQSHYPDVEDKVVAADYKLTDEIEQILLQATDEFNKTWAELTESAGA